MKESTGNETIHTWPVKDQDEGTRLDVFLRNQLGWLSRDAAKRAIASGMVRVNGEAPRLASTRLLKGQTVSTDLLPSALTMPSTRTLSTKGPGRNCRIVHEDDCLLVIDKPSGILTVPSAGGKDLLSLVRLWASGTEHRGEPHPVHRIDRDTSGLVVFAFGKSAQKELVQQFAGKTVHRVYTAIVHGRIERSEGRLRSRLRKRRGVQRPVPDRRLGAEAATDYRVLERFRQATLVEARLITGRTNQVRAQFAEIGHPVVGERKYARAGRYELRFRPVALHATRLGFRHSRDDSDLEFHAPPPDDFHALLAELRARPAEEGP